MAWLETASRTYVDHIIEARLRLNGSGNYCATGIMFHVYGPGTYYLALISNRGYFRLDAVHHNIPRPLIGWTEIHGLDERKVSFGIITHNDHLVFTLNNRWIAETHDSSIPGGHLGFALVSYEINPSEQNSEVMAVPPGLLAPEEKEGYVCYAWLDYLSVDSRASVVETAYKKWRNHEAISAETRLRLAESFAAIADYAAAYDQILKTWQQREEAARSVMATYTETRTGKELFFAAQAASHIGEFSAAEHYIETYLATNTSGPEVLHVLAEKTKILSIQNKYRDLAGFLPGYINQLEAAGQSANIHALYALMGHAHWNLQDYEAAALAWEKACALNQNNDLYAANAAHAYKMMGKKYTITPKTAAKRQAPKTTAAKKTAVKQKRATPAAKKSGPSVQK